MKYKPPLSDVVKTYIVEETKREIEFIKKYGKIADFDIKNCSVRNISDNVQNAFAKNIRDTKAEVFKEKDVFLISHG